MAEENKWKSGGDAEDEEDEEELDETAYKTAKDAVLFVIEVSSSMLTASPTSNSKEGDTDTATLAALKCAYSLMQQRIISNPNDMMGVLLYGTEMSKFQGDDDASAAYPHCYLLTDLDIPSADDVKALKALVEDEAESKSLLVPSQEHASMSNVLFCANQIFTTRAPNFSSRRLFIVTDNDDPHARDKQMKNAAAVRAKDLYDLGVIIELFPISQPDHEFDREKFYDAVARRALFSNLPLEIGPGFRISVKGYIIFKRQEPKRSCYVWLNGEQKQIATGMTTQMAEDTARTVDKIEIKKAYKFGGAQVAFTPEEVLALRHFGDPGIRIVGFKSISLLPFWANLRPSTFIYPSEDGYVGSTRVFSALQQKLLKDKKMGVAWFVARKNATPQIAAILPGAETFDDSGMQAMPPGMWITPLPFADDVRQNPETNLIRAPDPLVDIMRKVIQQLQLPKARYDASKYPNPSLQWHYRILQSIALDEDIPEKPDDKTIPRYRQIDKRAGSYVIKWGVELEEQTRAWEKENRNPATAARTKRTAAGNTELPEPGNKRVKTTDSEGVREEEMKKAFDRHEIEKITMPMLKAWLAGKGLSVSGKKVDLVDRVESWFERK